MNADGCLGSRNKKTKRPSGEEACIIEFVSIYPEIWFRDASG